MVPRRFVLKQLSHLVLARPGAASVVIAVLTVIIAMGIARIEFDDGLVRTFDSKTDAFLRFQADQALFGPSGQETAVHVSTDDFADPETFKSIRDFALTLALLEGVTRVESIFSLLNRPQTDGTLPPVFDATLDNREDISKAIEVAASHPLNLGRLLTDSKKQVLLLLRTEAADIAANTALVRSIEQEAGIAFKELPVEVSVTGLPVLRSAVIQNIIRDQAVMNGLGALIGVTICFLAFRSIRLTLVAGVPAVMALIWSLGLFGHLGIPITTVTNALPVLVMVLSFADSMHLTHEFRRQRARGRKPVRAIAASLEIVGPACVMASVTTAMAFSALSLSESAQVRELAIVGSLAVLISLAAVLCFHPLIAWWLIRGRPREETGQPDDARLFLAEPVWSKLAAFVTARSRPIAYGGLLFTILACVIYSNVQPTYSFQENVSKNSPQWADYIRTEQAFMPLSRYDVVLPVEDDERGISRDSLERLGAVHQQLEALFGHRNVVSLWSVASWLNPDDPISANAELTQLMQEAGEETAFRSGDGKHLKISILTRDKGSAAIRRDAAAIADIIAQSTAYASPRPWATGLLIMSAEVSTIMINDLHLSFLAAIVMSGVLITVWTRSFAVGLAATFVNFLPIICVGVWLVVSGNGLQFTSALALTIAFGIAVDDTVHALNRLRPRLLSKEPIGTAEIADAFTAVSPVLFATTLVLSLGLASTFASTMPMINYFGLLAISVFVLALAADLIVLPAVLARLLPGNVR